VTSAYTDATGRYRLTIRSGAYVLGAITPNALPRCSPVDITISADHAPRASISCDTGIR
jgi:hypothetical protein